MIPKIPSLAMKVSHVSIAGQNTGLFTVFLYPEAQQAVDAETH